MNRKGFTLIELLIVVVIIGILAAIAIPKFANTKQKAYIASMKSDLRNLVTAEEAYFADSVKYTTNLGTAFAVTSGNATPTIALTTDGWTASITNVNAPTITCAIFIGSTALAPATKEGEPKCQ
jgi:type II secretion system protein G